MIGTETSVTDVYATRLFARLYGRLAQPGRPDVIAALADARREVQRELETSKDHRDLELAALGEWAIVTVLAAAPEVPVLDPDHTRPGTPPPDTPSIEGLAARGPWYFVGRRAEQRRWPAELTSGSLAGIVVCGIGGTGKTTLAAEITARIQDREPGADPGQPDRPAHPGKPARHGDLDHPPRTAGPRPGRPGARCGGPKRSALAGPAGHPAGSRPGPGTGPSRPGQLRGQPAPRPQRGPRRDPGRAAGGLGQGPWPEPAADHLPLPVHSPRRRGGQTLVPAAGRPIPGRNHEAGLVPARPGRPRRGPAGPGSGGWPAATLAPWST